MSIGWLQRNKKEGEEEEEGNFKIEIKPEDIQSAIKPLLDAQNSKLDAVAAYIDAQKKKEDIEESERMAADARKNNERRTADLSDPTNWLDNPAGMTAEMIKPLLEDQQRTRAQLTKQDVLGKMEYYDDPTFKVAVDQLISSQPLKNQADPSLILNAYKSVFFDKQNDIKEGKIKSQLSINSSNGRNTNGKDEGSGSEKNNNQTMSEAEKLYASKLGISPEKWLKSKNEMEFV